MLRICRALHVPISLIPENPNTGSAAAAHGTAISLMEALPIIWLVTASRLGRIDRRFRASFIRHATINSTGLASRLNMNVPFIDRGLLIVPHTDLCQSSGTII